MAMDHISNLSNSIFQIQAWAFSSSELNIILLHYTKSVLNLL